jgi:predicted RNA-binding Zn ribbon-like protein
VRGEEPKISTDEVREAGFVVAGEPLAVDLANTVKYAVTPSRDLLAEPGRNGAFWGLESGRLPIESAVPSLESSQFLREAIRSLLDSQLAKTEAPRWALDRVNSVADSVRTTPRLVPGDNAFHSELVWQTTDGDAAALAAVARSAIDLLAGGSAARLRQCASPTCSMLFVATNRKRIWCTADGCGNRQRVARFTSKAKAAE